MNKDEIIRQIALKSNLSHDQVKMALDQFINIIAETLSRGEKISIAGFGNFLISNRKGKMGINPQNPSQRMKIQPSSLPIFRPGPALKKKFGGYQ
jgi:nucleoid DNA-binding protein